MKTKTKIYRKDKNKKPDWKRENVTRVTICVSNELRERMVNSLDRFNWSAIAQKAFEAALNDADLTKESTANRFEELEAELERLKKQVAKL